MSSTAQTTANAGLADQWLQRLYSMTGSSEAQRLYDEVSGIYDTLNNDGGYCSPQRCVEAILRNLPSTPSNKLKVFDAGCGTGLVGDALFQSVLAEKLVLDGVDISDGMLAIAHNKGIYRDLEWANLNERINKPDGSYDIVMCVGTLTKGHAGPNVLGELARLTAKSGLIIATVHEDLWERAGFKTEIDKLQHAGIVQIVSTDEMGFLETTCTGGRMAVLRKK